MSVAPRVAFNDGELAAPSDLETLQKNVALWLQNDLLYHLFGNVEVGSTQPPADGTSTTALGLDSGQLAKIGGGTDPADAGAAPVRSFGVIGQSLRVVRVNATTVRVFPGWGLQFAASGVPAGESALRVVRLGAFKDFAVPIAGTWRRDIVCVKWNDKSSPATVQVMDADGNIGSASLTKRVEPEVDDTIPTIQVVSGEDASSAADALRPSVPSSYFALAELLVGTTGIANAAQDNGSTVSGIRDLRPRLVMHKGAGAVASRRATCSTDEYTAQTSARRLGAKAVGEEVVRGLVQIPTSAGVVVLDTSRDWRDMMVEIEHGALVAPSLLPGDSGGGDDMQYSTNPVGGGAASLAKVVFFSGSGSTDGTVHYRSPASATPADGGDTSLIFFADSTTGALKCRGIADTSGVQEMYFRAVGFGPLGKRPQSGVEA